MIVCICNGLNDADVKKICDSCRTKEEFEECVQKKMCERSCRTCYTELIHSFEKSSNEE
jgi:bacterioferritin-associated ferredoxin